MKTKFGAKACAWALCAALLLTGAANAQQVTTYVYDTLGRLTRVTHPNSTATTYNYDAADNRTSVVTATGAAGTPTANNDTVYAYPINASPYFVVTAFSYSTPLTNDVDPNGELLSIASCTQGGSGIVDCANGLFAAYLANPTTDSADSFTYTATDGHATSSAATVTVHRRPTHASPYAFDDVVHAYPINIPGVLVANAFIVFNPIANGDYDYNGYPLQVTAVTPGSNGYTWVVSPTQVAYLSDASTGPTDTFTYTISNGQGGTKTANVTVHRHP